MSTDVVDLRDFYESSLGQLARRMIRRRLREMWPDVRGQSLLGLGYAVPYLRTFQGEAERVLAMMPAPQGVMHWPTDALNATALAEESDLPLTNGSIDRVLLVHGIEHAEELRSFLREIWRVMAGGGRLIIVAPNRRGIWARFDRTPFGHGHPYTVAQLSRLLRDNLFTPLATRTALFTPPHASRLWLTSAGAWERIGERWFDRFAGVVIVEAAKQLYAPTAIPKRIRRLRPVPIPGTPAPARVSEGAAARSAPVLQE